ncbi:MAG: SHOCT domain-containing protein [Acidimicrobiales bacterium]|jgi:Tfp pilus assembly protein PilO
MIAATFGVRQVVYSLLWFFVFFTVIWLMVSVFIDIFRSDDLKGWAKALWVLLVLVLPLIGCLAYFIVRGDKMRAHHAQAQQQEEQELRDYVGAGGSSAEELSRLAELRKDGTISEEEFQQLKSEVMRRASDTKDH